MDALGTFGTLQPYLRACWPRHILEEWRDYIPHSVFIVTEALTPRCGPSCFNAWKARLQLLSVARPKRLAWLGLRGPGAHGGLEAASCCLPEPCGVSIGIEQGLLSLQKDGTIQFAFGTANIAVQLPRSVSKERTPQKLCCYRVMPSHAEAAIQALTTSTRRTLCGETSSRTPPSSVWQASFSLFSRLAKGVRRA